MISRRGGGGGLLGGNGNIGVNKNNDICQRQYSERLGDQSRYELSMRLGDKTGYALL